MKTRVSVLASAFVLLMTVALDAHAASKIGVAAAVQNDVRRVVGSSGQPLSAGSDLYTNERIRTGEASTAQILLLDKTTLTMGSRAELTLDRFVYNPGGSGQVVLNTIRGAFRFVTGSQNPRNYAVKTPVGIIGVRGSVADFFAEPNKLTLISVEGIIEFTFQNRKYVLNVPGTAFVFNRDGTVQGPFRWDGTFFNTGAANTFPLYGSRFEGELPPDPLGNNLSNIDQLGAILQHSLPAPNTGGGGDGDGGLRRTRR